MSSDTQRIIVEHCIERLVCDHRTCNVARDMRFTLEGDILAVAGEVDDIATRTHVINDLRSVPGFSRIVDRICVRPGVHLTDPELRDRLAVALLGEPAFDECRIVMHVGRDTRCYRDPLERAGSVVATIANGVVTLEGESPSLAHARLEGLLAWWLPGVRAVRNEALVREEDNDRELVDGVRIALEKEPLVDSTQLEVAAHDGHVLLFGNLRSDEQRAIAERDAYYVLGVCDVDNRIQLSR